MRYRPLRDPEPPGSGLVDPAGEKHALGSHPAAFMHLYDPSVYYQKGILLFAQVRSFQPFTIGSSGLPSADTVDFENPTPHNSSTPALTFRVDTPLTTLSIRVNTNACSLLW